MPRVASRTLLFAVATTPFLIAFTQQDGQKKEPLCEEVFANIKVFKGVPATDLIPAMEFMSASMKYQCSDCHDPKNYSADTRTKETARHMVLMQRDINAKNFNNRTEVTCMTCHRGAEHPVGTPIPEGISLRHKRFETAAPKPEDLFINHIAAMGEQKGTLVRTGVLTAPNDESHKVEKTPVEFIQAPGGKYKLVAGERKLGSDGAQTWYGTFPMSDEPAFTFNRIGRDWRSKEDFTAVSKPAISGKDTVGKTDVVVVRGTRSATSSTEELYFDPKSNLLVRLVNVRRSSLGNVLSSVDYSNFKTVGGVKTPMKVVATFAGGEQWIMEFKSAKIEPTVNADMFKMPGG